MVTLIFKGPSAAVNSCHAVLRQVLSDANYETANLKARPGSDNGHAQILIRRIKAGTMAPDQYPLSQNSQNRSLNSGIDVWENEGGSIKGVARCRPV